MGTAKRRRGGPGRLKDCLLANPVGDPDDVDHFRHPMHPDDVRKQHTCGDSSGAGYSRSPGSFFPMAAVRNDFREAPHRMGRSSPEAGRATPGRRTNARHASQSPTRVYDGRAARRGQRRTSPRAVRGERPRPRSDRPPAGMSRERPRLCMSTTAAPVSATTAGRDRKGSR